MIDNEYVVDVVNMYPGRNGEIRVRKGWKSFRGMVYQLKLINKNCLKHNWAADFTIRLPIKWK